MRKSLIFSGLVLIGLVLSVSILSLSSSSGYASLPNPLQLLYPGLTPLPAQSPIPNPFATMTAVGRPQTKAEGGSAISPPVTEARVRDYIATHLSTGGIMALNTTVESVQFITIKQLKVLLNNDPFLDQFPLDEKVVYVTLIGDFSVPDAPTDTVMHSAYRVFSARTGNELMGGLIR